MKTLFQHTLTRIRTLILCLLCAAQLSAQEVEVRWPKVWGLNQGKFSISYTFNDVNVSEFRPQRLPHGLTYVGLPSRSQVSSTSIVNGQSHSQSSVTYEVDILPVNAGDYTIPGALVVVGGHSRQTRSVKVRIVEANSSAQQGTSTAPTTASGGDETSKRPSSFNRDGIRGGFNVVPSRTRVYEQEPVLLTYKAHINTDNPIRVFLAETPAVNECVSVEIKGEEQGLVLRNYGDHVGYEGTVWRTLVFPQQSGKVKVPGISFGIDLNAFRMGSPLNSLNVEYCKVPDLQLEVLPLPEGKPASFTGAVGSMKARGKLIAAPKRTGESGTYRVVVSGQGNLRFINPPHLNWPDDFQIISPRTIDSTSVSDKGINGSMVFEYTFVPRTKGHYDVPASEFAYFDPADKSYHKVSLAGFALDVEQGVISEPSSSSTASGAESTSESILKWIAAGLAALAFIPALVWGFISLKAKRARKAPLLDAYTDVQKAIAEIDNARAVPSMSSVEQAAHVQAQSQKALEGIDRYAGLKGMADYKEQLADEDAGIPELSELDEIRRQCEAMRFGAAATDAGSKVLAARAVKALNALLEKIEAYMQRK